MKKRKVPRLRTDAEAEAFLEQDLSDLDFSQFRPARIEGSSPGLPYLSYMCYNVHMSTQMEADDTGSTTLTVRLPAELKGRLGELAALTDRTKSYLAGEAIARYVERELEIAAGIERGLEDMKAGRVIAHEEAMAHIDAVIEKEKTGRRKR